LSLNANEVKYSSFIDKQIDLIYQINESNITQEDIKNIVAEQELAYELVLDELMSNKKKYIENINFFNAEIFSLNKIISINKRAGNTYAVLRDAVLIKSYKVVRAQQILTKQILLALDMGDITSFKEALNNYITQNQLEIQKIYSNDYHQELALEEDSKTLDQAKDAIKEFYALKEFNTDMINNIYKLEDRMYRLNKYSKYHLIKPILYINSQKSVQSLNKVLEPFDLTVVKIAFISVLFILIYAFRKLVYTSLESYLLKVGLLKKYLYQISEKLRKPIDNVMIIININMALYVYNNFSNIDEVSTVFNMIYAFFFMLVIYEVINTVAGIKLNEISASKKKIKHELVNVGMKILNMTIIILGLLLILYFAGIDLTAVLSGLGIGALAVAFAAKDTIANFFGTLSILFSDVFSQGDWIIVDGKEGVVVEIGLRVTTIRTFDNALISIPNGTVAIKDVQNWDRRSLGRRIKMKLGVKYSSKSQDIKNAVQEIRKMIDKHPKIITMNTKYEHSLSKSNILVSRDDLEGVKKNLLVYLDEFGDSSMNILVYCFTKSIKWDEWLETKEEIMYNIMEIFERNSLEFAFPSISLYDESDSKTQD